MKSLWKIAILLSFISVGTASALFAQSDWMNFDENGNGTYVSEYVDFAHFLPSQVVADPSGGITNSPVLIYDLGAPVVAGDVALIETGQTNISKMIRFFPNGGGDTLAIFYSQSDGTPAGVGIPYSANPVRITETNNPVVWDPAPAQPGYSAAKAEPIFFTGFGYYFHAENTVQPAYLSGTNIVWKYTGAFSSLPFYVMTSTNMSLSPTNWSCMSTNMFDRTGSCVLTLPVDPKQPSRFYRIEEPLTPSLYY